MSLNLKQYDTDYFDGKILWDKSQRSKTLQMMRLCVYSDSEMLKCLTDHTKENGSLWHCLQRQKLKKKKTQNKKVYWKACGKFFSLCLSPPHERSFQGSTSKVAHRAQGIGSGTSMELLSMPSWNSQRDALLPRNTVRMLGNSRGGGGDRAFLWKKKKKAKGEGPPPAPEGGKGIRLAHCSSLVCEQLPVVFFQEFLLTQSQQNIETNGT